MFMNPAIIIPTFHIAPQLTRDPASSVYDHPTPLNEKGNLFRCLDSLRKVNNLGQVIVLVATVGDIEDEAARKVQGIVNQFPQMHTLVVASQEATLVQHRLAQLGFGDVSESIGLNGYASVRNLGLVVAHCLGFDSVVFVDDDEVVEDAEFLTKAMYGLGKLTRKGIPILAKSGFYFNSENTYYSMSQNKWYNHFWQQGRAFNNWITKAMAGPRLSRSNHVCGGCLALHSESYKRLSFDPWIMRGEDLDYLLDLRMYGSDIWFDNQWSLRHLPPKERHEGHRFYRDIFRWLYEYYKIEFSRAQIDLLQIKPASLMPYPGPFLEPGITKRIKRTAFLRSLARPDKKKYREGARAAAGEATEYAKEHCMKYFEFQYIWAEIMARVEADMGLRSALVQAAVARQAGDEVVIAVPETEDDSANNVQVPTSNVDPGMTAEIRLNLSDLE